MLRQAQQPQVNIEQRPTNNDQRRPIKKKIFITIPWFLPAFRAGGPIRSIANLVDQFDTVEYWIFTSDHDVTGIGLANVDTGQWTDYNAHTKVWYAKKGRTSQQLTRQVEIIQPDVIFMVGLYSWYFTMVPLLFCKAPGKILSVRGMLHPGALGQKNSKKKLYIRALKLFGLHNKVWFHATDAEEKAYIQDQFGQKARVEIAGNIPIQSSFTSINPKVRGELKLVTLALISPMKNILAVLKALRIVKARVSYEIYGAIKHDEYWEQCRAEIRRLPDHIAVDYKGVIPFTLTGSALISNHVFIMPSESENFGHAIYESLGCGRPVITSLNTPWNHLRERCAGINVDPKDTNQIAEAINYFAMMDEETLEVWSKNAVDYSNEKFDLQKTLKDYERMFSV